MVKNPYSNFIVANEIFLLLQKLKFSAKSPNDKMKFHLLKVHVDFIILYYDYMQVYFVAL